MDTLILRGAWGDELDFHDFVPPLTASVFGFQSPNLHRRAGR